MITLFDIVHVFLLVLILYHIFGQNQFFSAMYRAICERDDKSKRMLRTYEIFNTTKEPRKESYIYINNFFEFTYVNMYACIFGYGGIKIILLLTLIITSVTNFSS